MVGADQDLWHPGRSMSGNGRACNNRIDQSTPNAPLGLKNIQAENDGVAGTKLVYSNP